MKLLHTADWHLNDRLRREDRTPHLRRRVEEVAAICDRERVDVLLVAGDLFSDLATAPQVAASFRHLRETFAQFLGRGGIVLAVTGNHDQDGRIHPSLELARAGMDLAEPPRSRGDRFAGGKVYLLDTAFVGRVRDAAEGFDVQFVLMPFPTPSRLLAGDEAGTTAGEQNRSIQDAASAWIRGLPQLPGYDPRLRTVLVAHLHVTGADVGRGLFRVSEEMDVLLDPASLPSGFDYVALGHIHKPQCIRGMAHVRYSGSLDRMDFGEKHEAKSVVLVDIGPAGRRADPVALAIEPTPMVELTITDASTCAASIAALVPDSDGSLVRVEVAPSADDGGDALDREIRQALPNVAWIERQRPSLVDAPHARVVPEGADLRTTVLDYLRRRLREDDPQREGLLDLASRFLDGGAS